MLIITQSAGSVYQLFHFEVLIVLIIITLKRLYGTSARSCQGWSNLIGSVIVLIVSPTKCWQCKIQLTLSIPHSDNN